MLIRGQPIGASRGHETARCVVHESPRARDTKASGPVVESRKRFAPRSKFSTCRGEGGKATDFTDYLGFELGDLIDRDAEKEFRIEFSFVGDKLEVFG